MKKTSFIVAALIALQICINAVVSFAAPANPMPVRFTQPNGSVVTLSLRGDEFLHWAVTIDGYTLLQNRNNGWEYAISKEGKLHLSGVLATDPAGRNFTEKSFLTKVQKGLFFSQSQVSEIKEQCSIKPTYGTDKAGAFPTLGNVKLLMILANFSNTTTTYTQSQFDNYMNQANYNGTGSFKDFYYENSYGQLSVATTVSVWVKVPGTHDSYGPDSEWGRFAYEACVAANASVDFSQFAVSGTVPGVAIIHQGPGQEGTSSTKDIWSHSWDLASAGYTAAQRTFDGVVVSSYTVQPEKSGTGMATIGVMCHEFGHNLGAPDYYDTNYSTGGQYPGTGDWDVMCGGSYNGTPGGAKPAHHNVYTKSVIYNWLTPTTLSSATSITNMPNFAQNAVVYKYTTTTSNEYFLLENRQQVGFDAGIPGHGLVIYHVDGSYITAHMNANDINATSHQGLHPEAAGGTIDATSCPFPGTGNKTSFTDATTPNSKSWANAATNKPITSITETSGLISFAFMGGAPTGPVATTNAASSITTTGATLNGAVNPNGVTGTVTFEYGTTTSYGNTVNATPNSVSGTTSTNVSAALTGLASSITYNYRVKLVTGTTTTYGANQTFTTTMNCGTVTTFPFNEGFANTTLPNCWSNVNNGGTAGQVWQFGTVSGGLTGTGNYAFLNSDAYGSGNSQNADLITTTLNLSTASTVTLAFKHYFKSYTGSSAKVSYSINNGSTWTDITSFTATTANPATFSQAIAAVAGQSQVKFKFNYTGSYGYYWCVEDVSVTTTTGGTGSAPTATTGSASNVVSTTATLNGTVNANNASTTVTFEYGTTTSYGSTASAGTVTGTTATAVTANLTGLTANTTYNFRVKAVNSYGTTYGTNRTFTTTGGTVTYCTSQGGNVTYEWIDLVKLGTLNNVTATKPASGYSNFTTLTAPNIAKGSSQTIYFSAGFKSSVYTEYFKIYIDYNKDGDFTDAGETIASGATTTANQYFATFTVPTTATVGTTRMRVVMSDNSATTSCGSYSYGETEDYTVNITATKENTEVSEAAETLGDNNVEFITLYPNPTSELVNVAVNGEIKNATVQIVSVDGKEVKVMNFSGKLTEISVSELPSGVYMMIIDNGEKQFTKRFIKN